MLQPHVVLGHLQAEVLRMRDYTPDSLYLNETWGYTNHQRSRDVRTHVSLTSFVYFFWYKCQNNNLFLSEPLYTRGVHVLKNNAHFPTLAQPYRIHLYLCLHNTLYSPLRNNTSTIKRADTHRVSLPEILYLVKSVQLARTGLVSFASQEILVYLQPLKLFNHVL